MSEEVSGWLLFNATSAIFQLYHGDNKLIFNEMMLRSALYTLSWIFIVLAHWNNSPQIDMSPHSDTLSRFRANQSLFFLLTAAYLAKKQQNTNFIVFGFTRSGLETHDLLHSRRLYFFNILLGTIAWWK